MNLFDVGSDYYLAHCVSYDFALGAGIAKEFEARFGLRSKLKKCSCYGRYAILIDHVFNLVTKDCYWHKPTYFALRQALEDMKRQCASLNIKKIAMPKIGCGLDRLSWSQVSKIIQEVFDDTDIEILICICR